jgi:hypothetical protein
MREYFSSDEMNVLHLEINKQEAPEYSITIHSSYGKQYRSDFVKIKTELSKITIDQLGDNNSLEICGHTISREQLTITKRSNLIVNSNEVLLEKVGMSIILDKTQNNDVKMHHFIRMVIYHTQRIRKNSGIRPWNKLNFYYNTSSLELNEWLYLNREYLESNLGYPIIFHNIDVDVWSNTNFSHDEIDIKLIIYKLD